MFYSKKILLVGLMAFSSLGLAGELDLDLVAEVLPVSQQEQVVAEGVRELEKRLNLIVVQRRLKFEVLREAMFRLEGPLTPFDLIAYGPLRVVDGKGLHICRATLKVAEIKPDPYVRGIYVVKPAPMTLVCQ